LPCEEDLAGLKQKLLASGANVGITDNPRSWVSKEWAASEKACWQPDWTLKPQISDPAGRHAANQPPLGKMLS
jgi:hypothetical protein